MGNVYVIGTCDTKQEELDYVCSRITGAGVSAVLVDVGTRRSGRASISNQTVAEFHPNGASAVLGMTDRGDALNAMGLALTKFIASRNDIDGVIGLGGSGNTGLVSRAMRALPVGLPKVLVSTIASGDVSSYVGASDIAMISSITDIAGLNRINRVILGNSATAIAAMASRPVKAQSSEKPEIGLSQFGVTTPCVDAVRKHLSDDFDCISFHATGTGGQALEKLIESRLLSAVVDITTTEIADHIVGGVLSAGETRLDAIRDTGIPCVLSLGALDIVNFWGKESIPEKFSGRLFHMHNPEVTLMRTSTDESEVIGRWIGNKLAQCQGKVRVLVPLNGLSALDAEGKPFWDREADEALVRSLEASMGARSNVRLVKTPFHINDEEFAVQAAGLLREIV